MQRSALCRSRRAPSHENLLAKIGVDTAENEPLEVWGKTIQYYSFVSLMVMDKRSKAAVNVLRSTAARYSAPWATGERLGPWGPRKIPLHDEWKHLFSRTLYKTNGMLDVTQWQSRFIFTCAKWFFWNESSSIISMWPWANPRQDQENWVAAPPETATSTPTRLSCTSDSSGRANGFAAQSAVQALACFTWSFFTCD